MSDVGPRGALLAVALGGVCGAEARYGAGLLIPHDAGQFALSTWLVNVSGSLLLGVVIVLLLERRVPSPLVRPFLTSGVLGGYTTFSTFGVDVQNLVVAHRLGVALFYVLATLVSGWAAVWLGLTTTRRVVRA